MGRTLKLVQNVPINSKINFDLKLSFAMNQSGIVFFFCVTVSSLVNYLGRARAQLRIKTLHAAAALQMSLNSQ